MDYDVLPTKALAYESYFRTFSNLFTSLTQSEKCIDANKKLLQRFMYGYKTNVQLSSDILKFFSNSRKVRLHPTPQTNLPKQPHLDPRHPQTLNSLTPQNSIFFVSLFPFSHTFTATISVERRWHEHSWTIFLKPNCNSSVSLQISH